MPERRPYVRPLNLHGLRLALHRWHAFWCDWHFDRTATDDLMRPTPPEQRATTGAASITTAAAPTC